MKPIKSFAILTFSAAAIATVSTVFAADGPPVAPVRPVTDTYFGTSVQDNYRYMEDSKDPEVQQWMQAQADYTHNLLDGISGRKALMQRIETLLGGDLHRDALTRRGERLFYKVMEPDANVSKLAYRDGVHGEEHVVVDPAQLAKDSAHHVTIDWYSPSWDGRYVAYGISEGGSEKSVLHVVDLQTGTNLSEAIDRTSRCIVSWRSDNRSFFYLRYPKPTTDTPLSHIKYNAVTFIHRLGEHATGDGDEAVFGHGVSPKLDVAEGQATYVLLAPGSPYAVAVANHNMANDPNTFYVASLDQIHGADTPWRKIAVPDDGVTDVQMRGDRLYLLSEKGASRYRILSMPAAHPDLANADVIVPEGVNVIDAFALGSDAIYVGERAGGSFELKRVSFDGRETQNINLPFDGTIAALTTDPRQSGVMFNLQGWVKAPREFAYEPQSGAATDTGLIPPSKTESDDVEAHDEFATSYDGTRIPVSIIARKGVKRDGSHPTIVFAYGSYGISFDPIYHPQWQAWLDHGGVFAVAHVRGGGEYGDEWHRAGQKLTKINSILDFDASAQYLIDQHYTQSKYLAANGGSAGGIVMGGAIEINPALFHVVIDTVGVSDALRFETSPNGPPNVPEFGSTSTESGFHGLYSMSAYANVHDGTPYPAVIFSTGVNDPRVSPWQMLKMAARMQAATSSGRPVLLRVDYDGGHGLSASVSQNSNELADQWSFALWQMNMPGFQLQR